MTIDELKSKIKGITHWLDFDIDIPTLYEFASNLEQGQVYFEIGTAFGNSAIAAALSAKDEVEIHTVDNGQSYIGKQIENLQTYERKVLEEFSKMNMKNRIVFHCGNSWDIRWSKGIHLLFIDGEHSFRSVKEDIEKWVPYVAEEGYVLFHDYDHHACPGVKPAVDSALKDFHLEKVDLRGTIFIAKKKIRSLKDCSILTFDYKERKLKERRILCAEAVLKIRSFYPEIPIYVVADYEKKDPISPFKEHKNLEVICDLNIDLLPHLTGHGYGLDTGFRKIESEYIFTFDHDIMLEKDGILEKLLEWSRDTVACGGSQGNKATQSLGRSYVHPMLAIFDPRPIRKFNLSFFPLIFRLKESPLAFATGQFLCYRLIEEGLKIRDIPFGWMNSYFQHLRPEVP